MGLNKARDKLFNSPQFVCHMDPVKRQFECEERGQGNVTVHDIETLLQQRSLGKNDHSGEEEFRDVKHFFKAFQMQSWFAGGKSSDNVLALFKLDKAGDSILSQPGFNIWSTQLKVFNTKFPGKNTSMLTKLMLTNCCRGTEGEKNIGYCYTLRSELLQQWAVTGKSTDDVFKLLKLDKIGENLLGSLELKIWHKYVNLFNRDNIRMRTTLFTALTAHYSDETPSTETIGLKLENSLFRRWVKASSSKDIFTLLTQENAGDNLLARPQFATFIKYTNAIRVAYRNHQ
ncbi:LOW QUALITY PROTEIN: Avirulence protein (Avh) [Phytophthora palmivora]|uniref:Avirulence protein (Avh) n=1 Tax=Phytophthora palmivora TaxID=4796 RepID=A0A2P4XEF2_9STRA|nr:LOW QUALITY PROTEIN: Avirulence protein (Avh) [Phytophthora palmivora]